MFYMTWGRRYGGQQCVDGYCSPIFANFEEMQDSIETAYLAIANELHTCVAPVGVAWRNAHFIDSTIVLWDADNSHPSLYGSYLGACVFYAMFFRKSPSGLTYISSLPSSIAHFLQNIAHITVFDSLDMWIDDRDIPSTNFSCDIHGDTVLFLNTSTNCDRFFWDFGDGYVDTTSFPVHIYLHKGTYEVMLIGMNECFADTAFDTIEISPSSILEESETTDIKIKPNPFNSNCAIEIDAGENKNITIHIFDIMGESVLFKNLYLPESKQLFVFDWRPQSKASGLYFINVIIDDKIIAKEAIFIK